MTDAETPAARRDSDEAMIDAKTVAGMCQVSIWHIYKMAKKGFMPPPIRLGRILRWKKRTITIWIRAGCPKRTVKRGKCK